MVFGWNVLAQLAIEHLSEQEDDSDEIIICLGDELGKWEVPAFLQLLQPSRRNLLDHDLSH